MELSKAEQKRRKQQKESLEIKLAKMLIDFENRFMTSFTKYHFDMDIAKMNSLNAVACPTWEECMKYLLGKATRRSLGMTAPHTDNRGNRLSDNMKDQILDEVLSHNALHNRWMNWDIASKKVKRETLTKFGYMTEANKGWEPRFDKLVLRVLSEAKSTEKMTLAKAGTRGGELEILISQDTQEFHCRFIWVDGVLVAPHHRFIVTTRKIK